MDRAAAIIGCRKTAGGEETEKRQPAKWRKRDIMKMKENQRK